VAPTHLLNRYLTSAASVWLPWLEENRKDADYTSRLFSTAASMNEANSGCGSNGRDFSSG
jgi:hypothetical protein